MIPWCCNLGEAWNQFIQYRPVCVCVYNADARSLFEEMIPYGLVYCHRQSWWGLAHSLHACIRLAWTGMGQQEACVVHAGINVMLH